MIASGPYITVKVDGKPGLVRRLTRFVYCHFVCLQTSYYQFPAFFDIRRPESRFYFKSSRLNRQWCDIMLGMARGCDIIRGFYILLTRRLTVDALRSRPYVTCTPLTPDEISFIKARSFTRHS